MNGLDFLIVGASALAVVRGLRRGLGREAIGLGATALLLFAALPLAEPVGRLVVESAWPAGRPYVNLLGFLLVVLTVLLAAGLLTTFWQRLISALALEWLDALGGALFGLAKAVAVWLIIVAFLAWLPISTVQRTLSGSVAASALLQVWPGVCRQMEKTLPPSWSLPVPHPPERRERHEPLPDNWRQV
ncbi:MAG: CvpA family protein [Betaproteobacteria bacterium]